MDWSTCQPEGRLDVLQWMECLAKRPVRAIWEADLLGHKITHLETSLFSYLSLTGDLDCVGWSIWDSAKCRNEDADNGGVCAEKLANSCEYGVAATADP